MTVYYRLDSSGVETNLQLYSLKQAAQYWNALVNEIDSLGDENVLDLKERIVFILSALGLSLTQLLGQNWPVPDRDTHDSPGELLGLILKCSYLDKIEITRLNKGFADLLNAYGSIRHFGVNKDLANYASVDGLTFGSLKRQVKMTLDIWDAVISIQNGNDVNELAEWRTVRSKVHFIGFDPATPGMA
jgi:hypothetical protein